MCEKQEVYKETNRKETDKSQVILRMWQNSKHRNKSRVTV